jgi:hypothetical protein
MRRRMVVLIGLVSVLAAIPSAKADLLGYWPLDENTGGQALDASGKGHNGTLNGATWATPGSNGRKACLEFNGSNARVEVPHANDLRFAANAQYTLAAWVNWTTLPGHWSGIVTKGREVGNWYGIWLDPSNRWCFGHGGNNQIGSVTVANTWIHVAMVYDNGTKQIYLNGVLDNQTVSSQNGDNTGDLWFGAAKGVTEFAPARIDDILIYDQALTEVEIQSVMKGLASEALAVNVGPADAATDVPRDVVLGWTPGEYAATHDVYFGTAFADVNNAGRSNPLNVLAGRGQTEAAYDPDGLLEFGRTYYWRVDEVNGPPDSTIFKGDVWSFTVEPYGYPVKPIAATASSFQAGMGPEKTIDGSGLTGDLHGTEPTTMWLSAGVPPNWIQYEFDKIYKLHELQVWNSNQLIEGFLGFGAKTVMIETSADGATWTPVADVPEFNRAAGAPGYAANTTVSLGGAEAKFVKLTITANWGGVAPQTGLSEVQFTFVPVQAREPQPATAATGVSIDTRLNWRPGREAASHQVFFGTDRTAVADGTLAAQTVTEHTYLPASLDFGTTYYWKVDEVGALTYPGAVWNFTTQEYATIDDFESYTDQAGEEVFSAWIDGLTTGLSGSTVGYLTATNGTFGESTIVHGGNQSMPLQYDNTAAPFFSEAERTFASALDWTGNGADRLVVYFRGLAPAFAETASGSILMNAIGADIWGTADQFRYAYKTLSGDGTMVARVDSIFNSNVWAKAGVMIRQSTQPGSVHAFMPITPGGASAGNGASFQQRLTAGGASTNSDNTGAVVAAPYWAKIERKGSSFSGYISPDGVTWTQLGTAQTIPMTNPVLIGLALCSHDAAIATSATFSNISTTGNVTGNWQVAEIGATQPEGNSVEGLYLAVTDSSGKSKVIQHPDPAATAYMTWQAWTIPLSEFTAAGVKTTAIKSLTLGVGSKAAPKAGGTGTVYVDDLGFGKPAQ